MTGLTRGAMNSCRHMLFLLLFVALGTVSCAPAPRPRSTNLSHSAYVWRQGWTPEAVRALRESMLPGKLSALNVLVGECGLKSGRRSVRPPWKELSAHGREISICVRVGTRKAVEKDRVDLGEPFQLLMEGLADAKGAEARVVSLQIDFDCPERLLGAYAGQIRDLREKCGGLPLTITALPSWLDAEGFDALVKAADGWTLQLHGTSRPDLRRQNALFELETAKRWVSTAMRHGRCFRVALPTYSYLACFGRHGEYLGMHAEQSAFPAGTIRTLHLPAEPDEIAEFLRWLDDAGQEKVIGVDWFRLPFPGDRQNWTMKGFGEVIAGKTIRGQVDIVTEQRAGLYDISVRNSSELPLALPCVRVRWQEGEAIAADSTLAWRKEFLGRSLMFSPHEFRELLGPGENRVIGWLRLRSPQPITTETTK